MTFYLSHLLVHYQFTYQIAFHLVLNQGNLASNNRLPHFTSSSRQEWRFLSVLPHTPPYGLQDPSLAESIIAVDRVPDSPTKTCDWQIKSKSCAKCWFFSLGFNSFSSNYSPKRIWSKLLLLILQSLQTEKVEERSRTNYKGGNLHEKATFLYLRPTGSSLYDDDSISKQCVLIWGSKRGLVNAWAFTGRKTEPPYNSFYLLHEGTVRFLCHP